MTKKKLTLFICLLVVALLLVLNGTLFVVRDIEVIDYRGEQTGMDKQLIAEYAGITGKNIFTVSEKIAKENVEKMMPYVKVEDIVRKFPWSVEIVVSMRVDIIAIKNSDNGYAIIDKDGVVMKNTATLDEFEPIAVFNTETPVTAAIGQVIGLDTSTLNRIKQIVTTFEQMGDAGYRYKNFCRVVETITFEDVSVSIKMREGATLVYDSDEDATNKLHALVSYLNSHPEKRDGGVFTVNGKDSSGKYEIYEMGSVN